jgi:hypothetical protein
MEITPKLEKDPSKVSKPWIDAKYAYTRDPYKRKSDNRTNTAIIGTEIDVKDVPGNKDTWRNGRGQSFKVQAIKLELLSEGITQETVRKLFDYDPDTGIVTRKVFVNSRAKEGDVVGSLGSNGYLHVVVSRKIISLHRLIWLWWYGYLPESNIDHISRDKTDNRLCNLREVSHQCNMRNITRQSRSKTGVTGVVIDYNKFTAQITVNNVQYVLGRFSDFTEAVCHRYAVEQCLNWDDCDSNSPAYQYLKEQGILK